MILDGQVRAYQSGLIDFKRDQVSVGFGIAAAITALYAQSTLLIDAALRAASFQADPGRVIEFFEAAMAGPQQHEARQAPHQAPPPPPPEMAIDEVRLAFDVQGLASTATLDETKARYRALAKQWHPDRFTNNATKSAEAGLRMSQINVAYSVICEAQGW